MGENKIGTTKNGIGPCYMDKAMRIGIRICDLINKELFYKKLKFNLELKNKLLKKLYNHNGFDFEEILKEYLEYGERLKPYIADTTTILNKAIKEKNNISLKEEKIRELLFGNDDTDSQKEMEEKGYTLPEYAFTVECDGVESEESGQLDVRGWIRTQFINKYNKKPLRNMNYEIRASNGSLIKGKTDKNGFIELGNLKFYKYSIRFEDN